MRACAMYPWCHQHLCISVGAKHDVELGSSAQVKEDVTRHRYGDDAHLDVALEKLVIALLAGSCQNKCVSWRLSFPVSELSRLPSVASHLSLVVSRFSHVESCLFPNLAFLCTCACL